MNYSQVKELLKQGWKFRKEFHHQREDTIDFVNPRSGEVKKVDYKHYHRCRNRRLTTNMSQSDDGFCYCEMASEKKK